jgi:hypothetical protein
MLNALFPQIGPVMSRKPSMRPFAALAALAIITGVTSFTGTAVADVYYVQPVAELTLVEGKLPTESEEQQPNFYRRWQRLPYLQPYGVLDGEGEIYVTPNNQNFSNTTSDFRVAIRLTEPRAVAGTIYLPKTDVSGMTAVKFTVPADKVKQDAREHFLEVKMRHYGALLGRDAPGAAWFRRKQLETRKQLGLDGETTGRINRVGSVGFQTDSLADTYALVSGGRAVSENLQLDRLLPESGADPTNVPLDSITGITLKPFDWKPLIEDAAPARDRLAKLVPDDQYALLFPSFQAMLDLMDHAGETGAVALEAATPRSETARVRERYERQLCLRPTQLSRLLGPAMIESVAVTGGDPYLRTGADIAVLFQAKDVAVLRKAIDAQVTASATADASRPERITGEVDNVAYTGYRTFVGQSRVVCSYVATLGDAVVVTNSPVQLERLMKTYQGQLGSLHALGEYTFFRHRYQRGDAGESALLVLSDNAIRKWCGPRWRIAASRRTRAAALMADMQAGKLDELVAGKIAAGPLHTDIALADAGNFTLNPAGVQSSVYGTLEFQTPIVELNFDEVSKSEAEFYERWRQGYERNWSTFFDPIAARLFASGEKLAVDLTVMPLIEFSDYREMVAISRGAKIGPASGDPHAGSLVHAVLALNTESMAVKQGATMAAGMLNVNPLSWIGESVALYLDNDPLWGELAAIKDEQERDAFATANVHRLPIALNFEVKSGLKLVAFLSALRTFIEQAAPGMTVWETLKHGEQSYVKVGPSPMARSGNVWDNLALYYSPSGDALVVSLSEDVVRRAIDRQLQRRDQSAQSEPRGSSPRSEEPAPPQWLGENFCVTADGKIVELLQTAFGNEYHQQMQLRSWSNLAILNEWHARYPGEDPVALHERFWQSKLLCPGGGEYRWNETWHTMESSAYGHPGEPLQAASLPGLLQSLVGANFGQTFEENGLRARVELTRRPAPRDAN